MAANDRLWPLMAEIKPAISGQERPKAAMSGHGRFLWPDMTGHAELKAMVAPMCVHVAAKILWGFTFPAPQCLFRARAARAKIRVCLYSDKVLPHLHGRHALFDILTAHARRF